MLLEKLKKLQNIFVEIIKYYKVSEQLKVIFDFDILK